MHTKRIIRSIVLATAFLNVSSAEAGEAKFLSIEMDWRDSPISSDRIGELTKDGKIPRLLVFLDGRFAGFAPGRFAIPPLENGLIVEIRLVQFPRQPFFSFKLTGKSLQEKEIEIIRSDLQFVRNVIRPGNGDFRFQEIFVVWPSQTDKKIIQEVIEDQSAGAFLYKIEIPAKYYARLVSQWFTYNNEKIFNKPFINEIERPRIIPSVHQSQVSHYIHSYLRNKWTVQAQLRELGIDVTGSWQSWIISSIPGEAEILFSGCRSAGSTTTRTRVKARCIQTMVLTKPGYQQCPFDVTKVGKVTNGWYQFHCDLIPYN